MPPATVAVLVAVSLASLYWYLRPLVLSWPEPQRGLPQQLCAALLGLTLLQLLLFRVLAPDGAPWAPFLVCTVLFHVAIGGLLFWRHREFAPVDSASGRGRAAGLTLPNTLTLVRLSSIPTLTLLLAVGPRPGTVAERFLVHGGTSGIGTTAIQLANALGARVFATAGSPEKCAACLSLGAERAINYRKEDFVPVVQAEGGADVILDMVGGDYIARNVRALAEDGRLVQIAFLSGPKAELNFARLMMRRLTITGSTLRPQSDQAKAGIAEELRGSVWPLLASGRVAPVIDSEFPLADAARAHERMESSAHIGKIVLNVG